jgi:glycosyltransferase involved in cell wall biosynthesis
MSYADAYRLDEERFRTILWPFCRTGEAPLPPVSGEGARVLSSGRAGSDWETLFAAAAEARWDLTVICSEADAERVRQLAPADAAVFTELSRAEHDEHLRQSDVYVMAMRELGVSAGHVRLMAAVEAGVPVVASAIEALDEYVSAGETALLVPPGDSDELRRTVDSLLGDSHERRRLRDAALGRARQWTYEEYFAEVRALILSAAER